MIQEHSCSKNRALLVFSLQACCNMELPLLLTVLGGEECRAMALPTGCERNSHAPDLVWGGVLWSAADLDPVLGHSA